MIKLQQIIPAAMLALTLSGCALGDYRQPQYYDMQTPQPMAKLSMPIAIGAFINNTAVRQKMLFRDKNDMIVIDEYNKFVQSPDQMLTRYLAVTFGNQPESAPGATVIHIYGKLFLFEFNVAALEAAIGIEYVLEMRKGDGTVTRICNGSEIFRSNAMSQEPDVVTRAFSRCMFQFANFLYNAADKADSVNPTKNL